MNPRHTADFSVHLHHVGPAGRAGPGLFFDCFQDAASLQSAGLGFSIRKLIDKGLTWVVPGIEWMCSNIPAGRHASG